MISRYTNVSKINQYPVFVTYRRKETCMHPHAEKCACTPSLYIAQQHCACTHKLRGACTRPPSAPYEKNPRAQMYSNTTSMANMRKQNVHTGKGKARDMRARMTGVRGTRFKCQKPSQREVCSNLCRMTCCSSRHPCQAMTI